MQGEEVDDPLLRYPAYMKALGFYDCVLEQYLRQLLQTTFGWGELWQNRDVLEPNRDFCWVLGAKCTVR